jgi:hypothetical protein
VDCSWRALVCRRGVPPRSWWPGLATSLLVVVAVVLVAFDVLIDCLPEQVRQPAVLSAGDLFKLGALVCVEADEVVMPEGHRSVPVGSACWS